MVKVTQEIGVFIDSQIGALEAIDYARLIQAIKRKYNVSISKATITKRAKALKIQFRTGRKRILPLGKRPSRSIFLDCAGAFFLKGAELELGLLETVNRLLGTSTKSIHAQRALRLAQQINAILLYGPVFGLKNPEDISHYHRRGLTFLSGQKDLPSDQEIAQYGQFLSEQKMLLLLVKEVTKACNDALLVRIDFSGQTFYLDAQGHTVWAKPNVPRCFSASVDKTTTYVKEIFETPSAHRPLILQNCPGYTFLPTEMFNLIHCLNQAQEEPIAKISILGKNDESLKFWQHLKPPKKCFFIAPLSPWQYAKLQGSKIVHDFKPYRIGPEKEQMSVADADIQLFNPQLNENIRLRTAMIRRKEERLALITNISRREQRYIRKIVELYFDRWPAPKVQNYYDLLEVAHQEDLLRAPAQPSTAIVAVTNYSKRPQGAFRLFLEKLHQTALKRFFSSEYAQESFQSMCDKFYHQQGYLIIRQNSMEVILSPFKQKKLQKAAALACQKFNQSGLKISPQKHLRISLQ